MAGAKPSAQRERAGGARREDEWIVLLTGRAASGKTTRLAQMLAQERGAVVAWDPTNGLAGAGRWDFEGPARFFLSAQAASKKRLQRVRTWGTPEEFRAVCLHIQLAGNAVFAVDEAHVFLPPTITAKHPFTSLLVQVRHLRSPLILVTWRPYNLPAYSRSSIARVLAFSTTDQRSLDWLAEQSGAPSDLRERLPLLPVGPAPSKGPRCIDWRI